VALPNEIKLLTSGAAPKKRQRGHDQQENFYAAAHLREAVKELLVA
jgi:hypothetical protein